MDPAKSSNPTRIAKLEETLNLLKEQGVEEVYVEVIDPNNICFTSVKNMKVYAICYSKNIEKSIPPLVLTKKEKVDLERARDEFIYGG